MLPSTSARLNRKGNEHFARGAYTDAHRCYTKALEHDRVSGDRRALVTTLGNLGNICAVSGRRRQAEAYYGEVLELQKELGDERGIGTTLANLGNLRADAGEWARAKAYYLEALDLMQRNNDQPSLAILYSDLGFVARETGEYEAARRHYEQSVTLMRRTGNDGGMADGWRMLARTYVMESRCAEALACCRTSLAIAERLHDELRMAGAWYVMADCAEKQGHVREAVTLLTKVVRVDRKFRLPKLEENTARLASLRSSLKGNHESAAPTRTARRRRRSTS